MYTSEELCEIREKLCESEINVTLIMCQLLLITYSDSDEEFDYEYDLLAKMLNMYVFDGIETYHFINVLFCYYIDPQKKYQPEEVSIDEVKGFFALFVSYVNFCGQEQADVILQNFTDEMNIRWGDRSEYSVLIQLYTIVYIYQFLDEKRAIELGEQICETLTENFIAAHGKDVSDLYIAMGKVCQAIYEEKKDRIRDWLEKGLELRLNCYEPNSIFIGYARMQLAEYYFIEAEDKRVVEQATRLIDTAEESDISSWRCYKGYASVLLAYIALKKSEVEEACVHLVYAEKCLEDTDSNNHYYSIFYIFLHLQYAQYCVSIHDDCGQELHARLAYTYMQEYSIINESYLSAINYLVLVYVATGRGEEARGLLSEAITLIRENPEEAREAAKYIFNTIRIIGGEKYFNLRALEALYDHTLMTEDSETIPDNMLFRLNILWERVDRKGFVFDFSLKISGEIAECESAIEKMETPKANLLIFLNRIKAVYFFKTNKIKDAEECFDLAISNALMQSEDIYFSIVESVLSYIRVLFSTEKLTKTIDRLVKLLPNYFNRAMKYEDTFHILKALGNCQTVLDLTMNLFEVGMLNYSTEYAYEVLTNCKGIYGFLLKEKRRIRSLHPENEALYSQIDKLQHEIITARTQRLFRRDSNDIDSLENEKRLIELSIAQTEEGYQYQWMDFSEICSRLPADAVLLDYYCCTNWRNRLRFTPKWHYIYFVLYINSQGKTVVTLESGLDAEFLSRWIFYLVAAMRARKNKWITPIVAQDSRTFLYRQLFWPVKEYITDRVKTLYIAPAFDIYRIPFGLLGKWIGHYLLNDFNIIYVSSARDLKSDLYVNTKDESALILGNASFTLDNSLEDVMVPVKELEATTLPLSKMEARLVSEKLAGQLRIKKDASKNCILEANPRILHIATHGCYIDVDYKSNEDEIINPLQRAGLFFAGANDWMRTGVLSERYGTGILTAEEIYYSKIKSPDLVVLSACFSADGERDFCQGIVGWQTAFQAVGTKAMLLSIWEVDDFAGSVLINRFYDNLKEWPAAEALRRAQLYLKDVTIRELREEKWFDESRLRKYGAGAAQLRHIATKKDNSKPFSHMKYWGGFVVLE